MMPINLVIAELFQSSRRKPRERKLIRDLEVAPVLPNPPGQQLAPEPGKRNLDSLSYDSFYEQLDTDSDDATSLSVRPDLIN